MQKPGVWIESPRFAEMGTLAYMSPEQTGRMNRAIDYRSDFYSLGVTFYQKLLAKIGPDEMEANIFDIVNQLNRGVELIGGDGFRKCEFFQSEAIAPVELARLNLIAGHKTKEATAYKTAISYLTLGLELLAANSWEEEYHLSLDLQLEAAEAEYLNTNYPRATELTPSLLGREIELYQFP